MRTLVVRLVATATLALSLPPSVHSLETWHNGPGPRRNIEYVETARCEIGAIKVHCISGDILRRAFHEAKTIRLSPASDDLADILVDLDLSPRTCDRLSIVVDSGQVVLTPDAHVSDGHTFRPDMDNLIFPSGDRSGVIVDIVPPIEIVTRLSDELDLELDLEQSFVFNGTPEHKPGVKRVLMHPQLVAVNTSTHGRITLRALTENRMTCAAEPVIGATVTAIDRSGTNAAAGVQTDASGNAWIPLLPGAYDIRIDADGYDSKTLHDQVVHLANETPLGDVLMNENGAEIAFDRDVAVFLAVMANIAYADGRASIGRGTLENKVEGDMLPAPKDPFSPPLATPYADTLSSGEPAFAVSHSCWRFVSFIDGTPHNSDTDVFIAGNEHIGDLVVGFRGTAENEDVLTDVNAIKADWYRRDGPPLVRTVHRGFRDAYFGPNPGVFPGLGIRQSLEEDLDRAIRRHVTDTSRARVYFTGHSLGAALATVAVLDLVDYLVTRYGYDRRNIVMYGFGTSRVFTERLESYFRTRVPNGYAVVGKEDYVAHVPGTDADFDGLDNEYAHIRKLAVLTTNIVDRSIDEREDGRYRQIGPSRIEWSNGIPFGGCQILGAPSVPGPIPGGVRCSVADFYCEKGHDQVQYIKRLVNLVDDGVPEIGISTVEIGPLRTPFLQLSWRGGVQGPCDWVGLYSTPRGGPPPTDANDHLRLVDGWEWVVKGGGYPHGQSSHTTSKNPHGSLDENKDFWVGYVDGFGRIIRTEKWRRSGARAVDEAASRKPGMPDRHLTLSSSASADGVTLLRYELPHDSEMRLVVYDVAGRKVREISHGARREGTHMDRWDLRDANGRSVGTGLYFIRLDAGGRNLVQKVVVAR